MSDKSTLSGSVVCQITSKQMALSSASAAEVPSSSQVSVEKARVCGRRIISGGLKRPSVSQLRREDELVESRSSSNSEERHKEPCVGAINTSNPTVVSQNPNVQQITTISELSLHPSPEDVHDGRIKTETQPVYGLKTLAGQSMDSNVDIIAIHDLGGHPDDAWTSESSINWLVSDVLLPSVAPKAHIMRYGYRSYGLGTCAGTVSLRAMGQRLLLALQQKRQGSVFRPLIFICHGLGGLIVSQALCEAYEEAHNWPGLFASVCGLLFFGTPFHGLNEVHPSELVPTTIDTCLNNKMRGSWNFLEPGNEIVQSLVDRFSKIWTREKNVPIACLYELEYSELSFPACFTRRRMILVDEHSACLGLSDNIKKYPLARSHCDMVHFSCPDEEDWLIVRSIIEDMLLKGSKDQVLAEVQPGKSLIRDDKPTPLRLDELREYVKQYFGESPSLITVRGHISEGGLQKSLALWICQSEVTTAT